MREDFKDKEDLLGRGNSPWKGIKGLRGGCGKTEGMSKKSAAQQGCSVGWVLVDNRRRQARNSPVRPWETVKGLSR